MGFIVILILILIIIACCLLFIKKRKSKRAINDINELEKFVDTESELLEIYPSGYKKEEKNNEVLDVASDTLNLDDLFKTISLEAEDNKDFDFGLSKNNKN